MTCPNIHKLVLNETLHEYLFLFSGVTDATDRGGAYAFTYDLSIYEKAYFFFSPRLENDLSITFSK